MKKRNLKFLGRRAHEIDKRAQFEQYKKAVLKKFPDAVTQGTTDGRFFITDSGRNIITDSNEGFPNKFDSVFDAWRNASICCHAQHTIKRNSKMFDFDTVSRKAK